MARRDRDRLPTEPSEPTGPVPIGASAAPAALPHVLRRSWRLLVAVPVAAILATLLTWALLPRDYTAVAVLVPATSAPAGGGGGSFLSQLPGAAGFMNVGDPQQKLLSTILRSRSLREAVIAAEPDPARRTIVSKAVWRQTGLDRRPEDGSITVTVSASDPAIAAATANRFVGAMNDLAARISIEAASRKEQFLERQITTARERLVQSEDRMLAFQQRRNAPEPQEQATRTLDAAATLQQSISAAELEVARLRRMVTPTNPTLRAAVADLAARREQLRQLTAGQTGSNVFIPLQRGSELRVETTRLQREFRKDEQVYVSLTAALAQTQIDENNNLPVLTVLDPAVPPTSPSGSLLKRLILAAVLGTLAAAAIVIWRALDVGARLGLR